MIKKTDWENAQKIFDCFWQKTDCLTKEGFLKIKPSYVVAIDDDIISAYYAAYIMRLARKQYGVYPKLLCVGGTGMLSKYMNRLSDGTVISEGLKLRMVALRFGDFPHAVLDSGENTGANLKEISDYLAARNEYDAPIIFCVTQRLSKRIERTVAFMEEQFPGTKKLNAFYYAPGETMEQMRQWYNGKAIADGLPLLSEAAALYDRMTRYAGKFMAEFDGEITPEVKKAGESLVKRFPVRVSRFPFSAPLQFWKMYWGLRCNADKISRSQEEIIIHWHILVP